MILNLTALQWKKKAREEIGDISRNHIFELRLILATSGGTWKAIFNGSQSPDIAFNSNAEAVKLALEAIDTIGPGNVSVQGIPKGPYYIEFVGDLAGVDLNGVLFTSGDNLIPLSNVTVASTQIGQATAFETESETLWDSMEEASVPFNARYLVLKRELGRKRLGSISSQVDTNDRDYAEKKSQAVAELRRIIMDADREFIEYQNQSDSSGANASLTTKIKRPEYGVTDLGNGLSWRR